VIGQEPALILETRAGEPSVWGIAEDDVAGIVGVFEEGRVGVLPPKAASPVCAFAEETRTRKTTRLATAGFIRSPDGCVKYADSIVECGRRPIGFCFLLIS
jgi:hypothetical protein